MVDELSILRDWTIEYLKHKDIIRRSIQSITVKDPHTLLVVHKDKEQIYVIAPTILSFKEALVGRGVSLVCFNTSQNFKMLMSHWSELVNAPHLCIYFVNPYSQQDKKWVIYPYTHHRITDKSALTLGLTTLFQSVDVFDAKELVHER